MAWFRGGCFVGTPFRGSPCRAGLSSFLRGVSRLELTEQELGGPAEVLEGSPGWAWAPGTIVHPPCPCPCHPPRDGRWSVVGKTERPARPHVARPWLPAEDTLPAGRCWRARPAWPASACCPEPHTSAGGDSFRWSAHYLQRPHPGREPLVRDRGHLATGRSVAQRPPHSGKSEGQEQGGCRLRLEARETLWPLSWPGWCCPAVLRPPLPIPHLPGDSQGPGTFRVCLQGWGAGRRASDGLRPTVGRAVQCRPWAWGPSGDGGCQAVWEGTPSGPAPVLLVPSAENDI